MRVERNDARVKVLLSCTIPASPQKWKDPNKQTLRTLEHELADTD